MISHFPLFLPTLRDLVANVIHRLWNCMVEFRPTGMSYIYYKCRNGPKTYPWNTPDSIGTLILSPSIITLHSKSRTLFYLWRSREWLTLSSVLEIVHYYDVCPFTIFFSWPSWSYGSWIYNYLCNQCLEFIEVVLKKEKMVRMMVMVLNATFNNISVISWRSVLLVTETGESEENQNSNSQHKWWKERHWLHK
jgi:hypothetical protein